MMQNIAEFCKVVGHYLVQFLTILLVLTGLFFVYAKYKTGKAFEELFQIYLEIVSRSAIFTGLLLMTMIIMVKYVPVCYIIMSLLCISSVSILFKYIYTSLRSKMLIVDIGIIVSNIYISYVLIAQETLRFNHYVVLAIGSFSFFMYQQTKKIV